MIIGEDDGAIEVEEGRNDDVLGGREDQIGPSGLRSTVGDTRETGNVWFATQADEAGGEGLVVRFVALGGDGAVDKGRKGGVEVEVVVNGC